MDITSLGHSSFRIRGKSVTLVTDPYESSFVGLKFPKHVDADIVTVTHQHRDHNATGQIEGSPFIISGPGEYEIKGVGVVGIATHHDAEKTQLNTVYHIVIDDINIVHLGDLGRMLTSEEVDELDGVDILFVPVGGKYTIDAATAAKVVAEIDPSVIIPMHYARPGLTIEGLAPISEFLKEMGKESVVAQSKFTIAKGKLPEEKQVIVLE